MFKSVGQIISENAIGEWDESKYYAVMYRPTYGAGFKIEADDCDKILARFPGKATILCPKFASGDNDDMVKVLTHIHRYGSCTKQAREDQDIIKFIWTEGVQKFSSSLSYTLIPIFNGIKLDYNVNDYDGRESIHININYYALARDLANIASGSNKTLLYPLTKYVLERGFDSVIDEITKITLT